MQSGDEGTGGANAAICFYARHTMFYTTICPNQLASGVDIFAVR